MPLPTPSLIVAALLTLLPLAAAAFFPQQLHGWRVPVLAVPAAALLALPYLLVSIAANNFEVRWLLVYLLLPVAVAAALLLAGRMDPGRRGVWIDFAVLALLGLSVDLRWFQGAWPARLAVFNKILLLDAGIFGFLVIRKLEGVGFSLRLRWSDAWVGLREVLYYAPIALAAGLGIGFLHPNPRMHGLGQTAFAWGFTFVFIAIPEELFFRGWLQNLLERRLGRNSSLILTATLFGLSHFNKRAARFNWRYVLLAAIAGLFYGRAWRSRRRVAASAITHATVDTLWSFFLR